MSGNEREPFYNSSVSSELRGLKSVGKTWRLGRKVVRKYETKWRTSHYGVGVRRDFHTNYRRRTDKLLVTGLGWSSEYLVGG